MYARVAVAGFDANVPLHVRVHVSESGSVAVSVSVGVRRGVADSGARQAALSRGELAEVDGLVDGNAIPPESTRAVRVHVDRRTLCHHTLWGKQGQVKPVPDSAPHNVVCTCWGLVYEAGASCAVMVMMPVVSTVTRAGGLARLIGKHRATPATGAGPEGCGGARGKEYAGSGYGSNSIGRKCLHSNWIRSLSADGRPWIRSGDQAENVGRASAVGHNSAHDRAGKSRGIGERHVLHSVHLSGRRHDDLVRGRGQWRCIRRFRW